MRAVGVTTWIKGHVLKGVAFTRRKTSGQGDKHLGQHLGRQVDSIFKTYCKSGTMGRGRHAALSRANFAVRALRAAGLTPSEANVFVKMGGIKTHLDGVATDSAGRKVVIELKSTQATAANHVAVYDTACTAQPLTVYGPNTERLHHRLQTIFGVRALGAHRGVTVVACADKAIVYAVDDTFPAGVFADCRMRALEGDDRGGLVPRWTTAARRGLPPLFSVQRVLHKQLAVLAPAGCAVVIPAPPSVSPRGVVAAAKGMLQSRDGPRYLVWPRNGTWHAVVV
jgi:hypothetical protein